MVERSLQWIVAGAATVFAVSWIEPATVTAPAMESPRLAAAPQAAVNAAGRAETEPLAFVEPPPLTGLAGVETASGIDPRAHSVAQPRPAQARVSGTRAHRSTHRRVKGERPIFRRLRLPNWMVGWRTD